MRRFALCAVLLPLCAAAAAERKPPPWEKPLAAGRQLYRKNCIVCHAIEPDKPARLGPNLFRFFQNDLTPLSRAEPTEAYMRIKILFGGDLMPAYTGRLSERNIDRLVEYIRAQE